VSETLGCSTGSNSEYVPQVKAEAATRALKERLATQYETCLEELKRGLNYGKRGRTWIQHVAPSLAIDQVLVRDATPLPPRSTLQAMDPI